MRVHCASLAICLLALPACTGDDEPLEVRVSNVGAALSAGQGQPTSIVSGINLSLGQQALAPVAGQTTVTVETRVDGGLWQPALNVVADFNSPPLIDVVLVADNSGSESDHLEAMRSAIHQFSSVILASAQDHRVGLVRVSTASSVLQPLTTEATAMSAAADELFVNNGWTALYDGVRLANEVLEQGAAESNGMGSACYSGAYRSIVVFTDSQDNNSADEHDTSYQGDGIDTTLNDLYTLNAGGTTTAVYTVGVGDSVDVAALAALAAQSGGQYKSIQNYNGLVGALHGDAAQLGALLPVCFEPHSCSASEAHVTVTTKHGNTSEVAEATFAIPSTCP